MVRTILEILIAILTDVIRLVFVIGIFCAVGWLIGKLFDLNINYFVAGAIGAIWFIWRYLIAINQYFVYSNMVDDLKKNSKKVAK